MLHRPWKMLLIAIAIIALLSGTAFSADPQSQSPLDRIVREALESNEDLKAAKARWQMFERKILPAGSLEDPTLSLGLVNYPVDSFDDDVTPMTGKDIKISQKFPFPGTLSAKSEMADQQARWYKGVYEDSRLKVARKARELYYQLFYLDRAEAVTEKNLNLLDDFIRLTQTRYEVGKGLQQDVLKAQVERSRLTDKLFSLQQQKLSTRADLNALLARSESKTFDLPESLELTQVEAEPEELQELPQEHRPLFRAYTSLIGRYEAQKGLARLDYRPDFTVWAGYRFRESSPMDPVDGDDFVSAGVTFNLPIYRKKLDETYAEAESGIAMANRQYGEFRNRLQASIHDGYAKMERSRKQALLYETGIIPQARQAFESTQSAYQVGKVDFLSVVDALMTLYRYEMEYYRALSVHEKSVARLEAEIGTSLPTDSLNDSLK
ncbi:MAG: TolC family protein [Desulfuromonadales bacterium]